MNELADRLVGYSRAARPIERAEVLAAREIWAELLRIARGKPELLAAYTRGAEAWSTICGATAGKRPAAPEAAAAARPVRGENSAPAQTIPLDQAPSTRTVDAPVAAQGPASGSPSRSPADQRKPTLAIRPLAGGRPSRGAEQKARMIVALQRAATAEDPRPLIAQVQACQAAWPQIGPSPWDESFACTYAIAVAAFWRAVARAEHEGERKAEHTPAPARLTAA